MLQKSDVKKSYQNNPCIWVALSQTCCFKMHLQFHHISISTNAITYNLHHIFPSIHKSNTNTKNLIGHLMLISKSHKNIRVKKRNFNKDVRKTSKCDTNKKIMNPKMNINSHYTIRHNTNHTIKHNQLLYQTQHQSFHQTSHQPHQLQNQHCFLQQKSAHKMKRWIRKAKQKNPKKNIAKETLTP